MATRGRPGATVTGEPPRGVALRGAPGRSVAALVFALVGALGAIHAGASETDEPPRIEARDVELTGRFESVPSREVYEAIAEQAGVVITFDPQMRDRAVSVDLRGLSPVQALGHVSTLAGHFLAPVNERALLAMQDTPQNRRAFEALGIRSFTLRYAEPKEVVTALRSLIDVRKITASEDPARITIRDSYPRLDAATRIVEILDREPWEIRLDVELLPIAPDRISGVAQRGGEVSPEVAGTLRRASGDPLALGVLGLVGTREARWKVFGTGESTTAERSEATGEEEGLVALAVRGRLSPDDPRLGLELDLTVLSPGDGGRNSLRQTSSFRISEGTVLALPILLGGREASVLLLTARWIRRGALDPGEIETFAVGTEANAAAFTSL